MKKREIRNKLIADLPILIFILIIALLYMLNSINKVYLSPEETHNLIFIPNFSFFQGSFVFFALSIVLTGILAILIIYILYYFLKNS